MAGSGGSNRVKIDVHIDHLILDGLPLTRHQGPLVQAAVERELARLLAADGLSGEARTGRAAPVVNTAGFELGEPMHPTRLGQQIARSVYRGIGTT
jgi:hypothetical protein